ncbi:MAG: hypothetical protein QOF68_2782, partial [Gaiellales bacterium]|nr:hypothetical protein [Gaiellales bacterium]
MRAPVAFGVVGAIVALSGAVGCSGAGASDSSTGGGVQGGVAELAPALDSGGTVGFEKQAVKLALPEARSTVIKTARLSLRVKSDQFSKAIEQAQDVATELGGLILSTNVLTGEPSVAQVVVRVPANRFNDALKDLRRLGGGTVRSEEISGQDVGQEFVDLEARERNLTAQQNVLLRLMDRAVTISDTIRVQNELSRVQGQIEQIRGRLIYLHDQADLSTISVSMRESDATGHADEPGELRQAFNRAWDGTVAVVTGVIVGAGIVLPVALLLGLGLFVAMRVWRPVRRLIE